MEKVFTDKSKIFDKVKKNKKKIATRIFIILMLAYPIFHFLFFWIFININSIILTFQKFTILPSEKYPIAGWNWAGFDNYKIIFTDFIYDVKFRQTIFNSLSYAVFNIGIMIPFALIASFFLFKRVPANSFFRVMFFLPSIIPIVALALSFNSVVDPMRGLIVSISQLFGMEVPLVFATKLSSQITIYVFMLWSGVGFNIILLSSAMAKIPMDILESGKLDGIRGMKELIKIFIPLIWPTLTTLVIFGLMSVFNVALQPMLLSGNLNNTIGLIIFSISLGGSNLEYASTLGLICTLFAAPVILLIKFLMEKAYADVSF